MRKKYNKSKKIALQDKVFINFVKRRNERKNQRIRVERKSTREENPVPHPKSDKVMMILDDTHHNLKQSTLQRLNRLMAMMMMMMVQGFRWCFSLVFRWWKVKTIIQRKMIILVFSLRIAKSQNSMRIWLKKLS